MLLKLKSKCLVVKHVVTLATVALLSFTSTAEEIRNLQVHGFVAQGVAQSSGSDFINDDGDVSGELTEVGINASYQISDNLRFAGQAVYLNGGNRYAEGARIDYALVDWAVFQSLDEELHIYLGRYKNYNWLYSSTRDVPMTRPSIVLPQSVYFDGFRDIAVGGDGIALTYTKATEQYGEFDFNLSYGTSNISDKQTEILLSEFATGDMNHDLDIQTSLFWRPNDTQWRFGFSLLDSDFSYDQGNNDRFVDNDIVLQRYTFNAIYEGELWEFSTELLQERFLLEGFYFPEFKQDNIAQGLFLQSRYKWQDNVRLLARFEKFWANKDDRDGSELEESTGGATPAHFAYHHDYVLGAEIDLAPNLRLQIEHHWFDGTARLTPVVLPNVELNHEAHWQLWAAQLIYWF